VVRPKARVMRSVVEQLTLVVAAVAEYRKAIEDFFARIPTAQWARTLTTGEHGITAPTLWAREPQLAKNRGLRGQNIAEIAKAQGKEPVDAFLDLAVEEDLTTVFSLGEINMDTEAVAQILGSPYAVVGLSDGGAHVQFHSNVSNPTRLLGYWVREKRIMSLELAIRRLTFDSASAFGIYDRGLLQPGMAADLVVFDPDTVRPVPEDVVHDFPSNGWRMRELAEGIHYTVVNGEVLLEKGTHTGSHPGRVLRNARYQDRV
jgi:N-acyl-D-aspartate/D-glutamate deacylase